MTQEEQTPIYLQNQKLWMGRLYQVHINDFIIYDRIVPQESFNFMFISPTSQSKCLHLPSVTLFGIYLSAKIILKTTYTNKPLRGNSCLSSLSISAIPLQLRLRAPKGRKRASPRYLE